jgi:methylglutaconyl-CoA hydratase
VIGPHLVNAVGRRQALRLALSTERIGAAQAEAMGLVHRVVGLDALDATVDAVVRDLLVGGPRAQGEIKRLFGRLEVGPITPDVLELTARTISRVRGTDEAREGFDAFLSKRPANWIPQ